MNCPIDKAPGTYILLLKLPEPTPLQAGRTLRLDLEPGLYAYVGSALGPGGLIARLNRHASVPKRRHWHIDYLMPHAHLLGALVARDHRRLECRWASWTGKETQSCVNGFGASDCRCRGHLFYFGAHTTKTVFVEKARKSLKAHQVATHELQRLMTC